MGMFPLWCSNKVNVRHGSALACWLLAEHVRSFTTFAGKRLQLVVGLLGTIGVAGRKPTYPPPGPSMVILPSLRLGLEVRNPRSPICPLPLQACANHEKHEDICASQGNDSFNMLLSWSLLRFLWERLVMLAFCRMPFAQFTF